MTGDGRMTEHALNSLVQRRDLKVGHFIVEFATPGIGHIL
jgi:hypothetical protein